MKIVAVLADKFEDIEALGTVAILRRSGIEVDLAAALNADVVTGAFGTKVIPDKMMKDVDEKDYDGLFIPGGSHVATLRELPSVKKLVLAFAAKKKLMCAICAGPSVFGMLGLLDGLPYTSFPSTEKFMPKGIRMNQASVVAGNIVTGAAAGAVMEFAYDVIRVALGKTKAEEIQQRMLYRVYEK